MVNTEGYVWLKLEFATGLKLSLFPNCFTLFLPLAREGSSPPNKKMPCSSGKEDYQYSSFIEIVDFYCMTLPFIYYLVANKESKNITPFLGLIYFQSFSDASNTRIGLDKF